MDQGFSLTEVLVSLFLMTSTSLALFKQQWQVSQLFNHVNTRAYALSQLDNAAERLLVGYNVVTADVPFKLEYTRTAPTLNKSNHLNDQRVINLQLTWAPSSASNQECCTLVRQVVVELNDA